MPSNHLLQLIEVSSFPRKFLNYLQYVDTALTGAPIPPIFSPHVSTDTRTETTDDREVKELLYSVRELLYKHEQVLNEHQGGVERRLENEIAKREESERKISEKQEELQILKLEKEIKEGAEKKSADKIVALEQQLEKESYKKFSHERELK